MNCQIIVLEAFVCPSYPRSYVVRDHFWGLPRANQKTSMKKIKTWTKLAPPDWGYPGPTSETWKVHPSFIESVTGNCCLLHAWNQNVCGILTKKYFTTTETYKQLIIQLNILLKLLFFLKKYINKITINKMSLRFTNCICTLSFFGIGVVLNNLSCSQLPLLLFTVSNKSVYK